jgi:hypothetical protein
MICPEYEKLELNLIGIRSRVLDLAREEKVVPEEQTELRKQGILALIRLKAHAAEHRCLPEFVN